VIKPLWRNDKTFYQGIHTQAGFLVFALASHMNHKKDHEEIEILANVRVEAHYRHVLDSNAIPQPIV